MTLNVARLLTIGILAMSSGLGHAYSALSVINGHVGETVYVAYDLPSQQQADTAALKGCRSKAKENGIGKLANKCRVALQASHPGYGALACSDGGCGWGDGYANEQAAIGAARSACINQGLRDCLSASVTVWLDKNWPPNPIATKPTQQKCDPQVNCEHWAGQFRSPGVNDPEGEKRLIEQCRQMNDVARAKCR